MIAACIVLGGMIGALAGWLTFTYLETNKDYPRSGPPES